MSTYHYIILLEQNIKDSEYTLQALKNLGISVLDPNYRLEQGKLNTLVRILKDLNEMSGREVDAGFYPDLCGFLSQ